MTDYCFRNDQSLMCNALDPFMFQQGKISCRSCQSSISQIVRREPAVKSQCLDVTQIPFCLTYDVQNYSTSNTYRCSSCTADYYLSPTFQCVKRRVKPQNCVSFSPNNDLCTACAAGYYLADDRLSCTSYPRGIPNCLVYSSATTCESCK